MFYNRFIDLCKEKREAPSRAALNMGFSKSTVTAWRRSGKTPTGESLKKIADYFNVTIDYLLGNTNEKNVVDSGIMHASMSLTGTAAAKVEKSPVKAEDGVDIDNIYFAAASEIPLLPEQQREIVMALIEANRKARMMANEILPKEKKE